MSRPHEQRLNDIQAAIDAIAAHMERGDLSDGLIFDVVRVRLIEIGEAVKDLPPELLDHEPGIPWIGSPACATTWRTATSKPRTRSCRAPSTTISPSSPML